MSRGESTWGDFVLALNQYLQPWHRRSIHGALWQLGIIFFCFFYTAVVFNPEETADNLKRYGGFIPGIRPGKNTEIYLDYVLTRITVTRRSLSDLHLPGAGISCHHGAWHSFLSWGHEPPDRRQCHDRHGHADPEPLCWRTNMAI
jgi:hypothetical protein